MNGQVIKQEWVGRLEMGINRVAYRLLFAYPQDHYRKSCELKEDPKWSAIALENLI